MAEEEKKAFDIQPYVDIINGVIAELGVNPDEVFNRAKNMWTLYKGSAQVIIEFFTIENTWYIDIRSSICPIPTSNVLPFYRKLLELNHWNIGIKFSVEQDRAWLSINRELEGMDKSEAMANLNRVGNMSDEWDEKLRDEFFTPQ
ncbi:MAG: YbjN domain-containing protein [bacterium]